MRCWRSSCKRPVSSLPSRCSPGSYGLQSTGTHVAVVVLPLHNDMQFCEVGECMHSSLQYHAGVNGRPCTAGSTSVAQAAAKLQQVMRCFALQPVFEQGRQQQHYYKPICTGTTSECMSTNMQPGARMHPQGVGTYCNNDSNVLCDSRYDWLAGRHACSQGRHLGL